MPRRAALPPRYVQGPGAFGRFGVEAARFADRALVVADSALPAETIRRLDATGVAMHLERVPPECTEAAIASAAHGARSIGIGITTPSIAAPIVARCASRAGEMIHSEPFAMTEARVMAAILQADRLDHAANDHFTQEPS